MAKMVVIGDVHGCYKELMDLLDKVELSGEDNVYFVGDLITKGPDSLKVLEFMMEHPEMKSVIGNHEYALLMDFRDQPVVLKKSQKRTKKDMGSKFNEYMSFISKWPLVIDIKGDGRIVHAGLRPELPLEDQSQEDLTNIRTINGAPWFNVYNGVKTILFGHWVTSDPIVRKNALGIDTGCVYGGRLTAVLWPERKFISVKSRENYAEWNNGK